MRTLMTVTIPAEKGSVAVQDGSMGRVIQSLVEQLRPEATYFAPNGGNRTMYVVFDLRDPSQLPPITEPLFSTLGARVEMMPCMNLEDVRNGLQNVKAR